MKTSKIFLQLNGTNPVMEVRDILLEEDFPISLEQLAINELIHRGIKEPTWQQVNDFIANNEKITYA